MDVQKFAMQFSLVDSKRLLCYNNTIQSKRLQKELFCAVLPFCL